MGLNQHKLWVGTLWSQTTHDNGMRMTISQSGRLLFRLLFSLDDLHSDGFQLIHRTPWTTWPGAGWRIGMVQTRYMKRYDDLTTYNAYQDWLEGVRPSSPEWLLWSLGKVANLYFDQASKILRHVSFCVGTSTQLNPTWNRTLGFHLLNFQVVPSWFLYPAFFVIEVWVNRIFRCFTQNGGIYFTKRDQLDLGPFVLPESWSIPDLVSLTMGYPIKIPWLILPAVVGEFSIFIATHFLMFSSPLCIPYPHSLPTKWLPEIPIGFPIFQGCFHGRIIPLMAFLFGAWNEKPSVDFQLSPMSSLNHGWNEGDQSSPGHDP